MSIKNSLVEDQDYMSAYKPAEPLYIHQEYPKWVNGVIVNSAEEEAATAPKSEESELDALISRAETLGIKIDQRWGLKRLREEVERVSR